MFVISMKANKKKILGVILAGILLIGGVVAFCVSKSSNDAQVSKGITVITSDNDQRIAYLKTFGWNVSPEAVEIVEIAIPAEFDDVYNKYNEIQKKQGFDLEEYKGKRAKRFSYEVTNYPNRTDSIRANIIVYKNQVIAGDICSLKLDGFMHGLKLEKQK